MLLSGLQGEVRIHHTDAQLIHNDEQQRSSGFPPQFAKKVKVKVVQSCPTLCDPMDYTVHGILQARILEWVAFPFSRGSSQPRDRTQVSHISAEPPGKPSHWIYKGKRLLPNCKESYDSIWQYHTDTHTDIQSYDRKPTVSEPVSDSTYSGERVLFSCMWKTSYY